MNVEYVSCKISSIRWLHEDYLKKSDLSERYWLCGTYGMPKNSLTIYSNISDSPDGQHGIYKLKNSTYYVNSDVNKIINYDKRSVFVSLSNGDILLFKFSRNNGLELINKWDGKQDIFNHQSTDLLVNNAKELISCGLDGKLIFIDMNSNKIIKSPPLTSNSIHCLDKISPNEVICGTTSGHVKLFDKRTQKVELSLENELSIVTTIQRNSHIQHIVACANDIGLLYLWDLRNGGQRPMPPASAHSASINSLRYVDSQPNLIFTSSYDGQLIKWNITNEFEIKSVDAIVDKNNTYPINCFDINSLNQLVFSDDNEVLYLTKF